jgi:DNA-binding NarL/FixJ family response regulator
MIASGPFSAMTMMSNIKKLKVLLVEDTPLIIEQINDVFASLNCIEEIRTASNEKDALRIVERFWPNVVIVDLRLKQGNGFTVLKAIRSMNFQPVRIVLTNYAIENYREYADFLGVDYFLDKAKDFESLCELVAKIHQTREHLKASK